MLIDSHCHLDAAEFSPDREAVIARAQAAGVKAIVIPAVDRHNWSVVTMLASQFPEGAYALGIHPLRVCAADDNDLDALAECVKQQQSDPRLVAIGEIGLDYFVPESVETAHRLRQQHFFKAQLKIAQAAQLPVLLHVRKAQDAVAQGLRQIPIIGGIAHAFNGSFQQAETFIKLGLALGFGGAITYPRALQIRRLATQLPLSAVVLETDAPDIAPIWLKTPATDPAGLMARNEPASVRGIAQVVADLRQISLPRLIDATASNVHRVLPRLC